MIVRLLAVAVLAALPGQEADLSPDWPTNPYWIKDGPPNGPGHKVGSYKELLETCSRENVGIKVNLAKWRTGEIGSFEVGDVLRFGACIGDRKSRISLNHKGVTGGGIERTTLRWMDEGGSKVLESREVSGGCG